MYRYHWLLFIGLLSFCTNPNSEISNPVAEVDDTFQWEVDRFADTRVIRYQVPGFDKLSLDQKKLVYYLTQAGLAGRDIMYDMNYRHNLEIRKAMDHIVGNYEGDKEVDNWKYLLTYAKRIWFANGIHHHYGMDKFVPEFNEAYLQILLEETKFELSNAALDAIFDSTKDVKKVSLDQNSDILLSSAVNFYDPDITADEAQAFYAAQAANDDDEPISHGLNSKLIRDADGTLSEATYSVNGLYGPAISEMIVWLEKAADVAENEPQRAAIKLLIDFYQSGDLNKWDEYSVAWVKATVGDIDYIHGFIEVYNDPIGYKGSYESIIQINDFEASDRMKVLQDNAQWFESNSTIMEEHKKENVIGVTYKVVSVAGESGDASPATPIGVNLPNPNWIRSQHGSKSVSLGNIIDASNNAGGGGLTAEFAHDDDEVRLHEQYGELASKLGTALHEVIGHASGKINPGVGTPKETLKSYASTMEEARADIVGLFFIMDPKMMELGLIPTVDVAKADYDAFISNGLLKQLRRIELGKDIEESHMRNRQLIAAWALEKGASEGVIVKVMRNEKTYFEITDYHKLRRIFGELLRELQRIKSEGDYDAARALVEGYGVKVDADLHAEVLDRIKSLDISPYSGFLNPKLIPVLDDTGNITDVNIEYPDSFIDQMLEYGANHSFL
ncbi:MAG: dipeptidyl peptidase 3 [Saprospiraceae bacterium]|nr:dipeptidyl peptidase 3 [Saprospiraceae bacterium]